MKYRFTVLNIACFVFLFILIVYVLINSSVLTEGEGWGVVAMFGLAGLGILLLILDFLLQIFIRNTRTLNIAGVVSGVMVFLYFFLRSLLR